jgi:hypothetical protein
MGFPDLLGKVTQGVKNLADHLGGVVGGARVVALPHLDPFAAVPRFLAGALAEAGAIGVGVSEVTAGNVPVGSAAKGQVPVPAAAGVVAVSTNPATGAVQWHIPLPGEAEKRVAVWVHRVADEAGRQVAVFRLPALPAIEGVRDLESAYRRPGLKALPAASALPQDVKDLARLKNVPAGYLDDRHPLGALTNPGRTLILVHGILDRIYGFALAPMLAWGGLLGDLQTLYGGRVCGFDHPTLADTPLENARALLALLPEGLELDLLCHSRGGLVVRSLLEDPGLRAELDARRIRVGRVIFMAAANQGSRLAVPEHLAAVLSLFATIGNTSPPALQAVAAAAAAPMLAAAYLAGRLPGVSTLIPGNDAIDRLNASPVEMAGRYSFIRANFGDTTELLLMPIEDRSDRAFGGDRNDLVVPFAGVTDVGPKRTRPAPPAIDGLGDAMHAQGHFHHLNLLDSPKVRDFILATLRAA